MTADKDVLLRAEFERWITAPPYEKDISRYGETGTYWPGCYEDYQVHLAWDAWKESARITAALAEKDDGVVVPIETLIIMRAAITEDSPLGKRAIAAYEKLKAERRNLLAAAAERR